MSKHSVSTVSQMRLATIFVSLGFLITLGLIGITLLDNDAGQFHDPMNPQMIVADNSSENRTTLNLLSIALDNFFILGYTAIFYVMYLFTKHVNFWAKTGLALGLSTAVFDVLENAILVMLNRIGTNFTPDPLIWVVLWFFTFVKDISSYMSGFVFAVLLIATLNHTPELRMTKIIIGFMLILYIIIGSLGLINPLFLTIRNLAFVANLFIASILFYRISDESLPS